MLAIIEAKKTVSPERDESSEDVLDVHKPLDGSIMTEIPVFVQPAREFKEEVSRSDLNPFSIHRMSIFPSILISMGLLLYFWTL